MTDSELKKLQALCNVDEAGLFVGTPHRSTALAESSLSSPPQTAAGDFELDFLQTCGIKDHVIREGDENTQLMLSELLAAYKFAAIPELFLKRKV